MKKFDYINDIHLDFWVNIDPNKDKHVKKIAEFTRSIVPNFPSNTLVIGGDLGHYNHQNVLFLKELRKFYKDIVLVFGNHDFYLLSNNSKKKYKNNSLNRSKEMMEITSDIQGIHYLDGDTIDINGTRFGGVGMWYDFSFELNNRSGDFDTAFDLWSSLSNDYKMIKGFPKLTLDMFNSEKEKLDKIINESDVIITHVGPDVSLSPYFNEMELYNSFYFFDGSDYFNSIANKMWCFGHIHYDLDTIKYQCRFINHALGYPDESPKKKIKTILY